MFHVPNQYRILNGPLASSHEIGQEGAFLIPPAGQARARQRHCLQAIASDGGGWEHVSVSLRKRCPTWDEMCTVKALFWDPEDTVVQYHPPASTYIDQHPYCLHLWRQPETTVPLPPSWMVGFKELNP